MKSRIRVVTTALILSLMFVTEVHLSATCTVSSSPENNDGHCRVGLFGYEGCYDFGIGPSCYETVIELE